MNIEARFAARTRGLAPSPIRKLAPLMRLPGMISLGGGYPNPETFAFASVDAAFRSGELLHLTGESLATACQ